MKRRYLFPLVLFVLFSCTSCGDGWDEFGCKTILGAVYVKVSHGIDNPSMCMYFRIDEYEPTEGEMELITNEKLDEKLLKITNHIPDYEFSKNAENLYECFAGTRTISSRRDLEILATIFVNDEEYTYPAVIKYVQGEGGEKFILRNTIDPSKTIEGVYIYKLIRSI